MSTTISLSKAMSELTFPKDDATAAKEETLVRAMCQVLEHERLQVGIRIPGVESVAPGRQITRKLISVLAQRGFMIEDKKLDEKVGIRIGEELKKLPPEPVVRWRLRTAAITGEKKPLPNSWKDLAAQGGSLPKVETLHLTHSLSDASSKSRGGASH